MPEVTKGHQEVSVVGLRAGGYYFDEGKFPASHAGCQIELKEEKHRTC